MPFNVVLIEPEIPNNTGNIGRLCLATGAKLHLVKPLGFDLENKRLKRAGLDYWKHVDPVIYRNTDDFFNTHNGKALAFFSSHGKKTHWSIEYQDDMFLIFGKESVGLNTSITVNYADNTYKIPLYSKYVRSLNLANAVGIVLYEGLKYMNTPY